MASSEPRRNKGRKRPRKSRVGRYAVPGERAVVELLDAAADRIERILVDLRREFEVVERAAALGIPIERVEREQLQNAAGEADPRGIVALAEPPPLLDLEDLLARPAPQAPRRVYVALDGVVDPQNLGAILRSCEFFGVAGVFWPKDRAVGLTGTVARASAGATERLAMSEVTNLAQSLRTCKDAGLWIVGTVVDATDDLATLCRTSALPDEVVLVLGSEGRGIRRLTAESCDFKVTLTRHGRLGSLNVAAAAAASLALMMSPPPQP
jgi:23S rRNA (guanosine2251-2'-O)-methyltransferase